MGQLADTCLSMMVKLMGLFHFLLKKLEWDHLGVLDIPVDKEVAEHKQMFLTCLMYLNLTWLCGYFGGAGVGLESETPFDYQSLCHYC